MDTQDPKQQPDSATTRAAARLLYEKSPAATYESVAVEFGVTSRTLKRWAAADGGWRKLDGPIITAKAHEVADRITQAVEQAGPDAGEEAKQAATDAARIEAAVDERAQVVARHRGEWNIVRGLVAEAVRSRDNSKAKLAVDVGRALSLAQQGERKAWGLDVEVQPSAVVVIERT